MLHEWTSRWLSGISPRMKRSAGLPAWVDQPLQVDPNAWRLAARNLERDYDNIFSGADIVVINGEGTLHHNWPGSLTLAAWARAAKRSGIPVHLVNCTIQSMAPFLLDELIDACVFTAVRESRSFQYLRVSGYNPTQASDAVFAWPEFTPRLEHPAQGAHKCIYTPGVLTSGILTEAMVHQDLETLLRNRWKVSYLTVEYEDERFEALARRLGALTIPLRRWTPLELMSILSEHDVVYSGRYHLIIFSWLAGRPVVPMPTNSWKIEGLFELAGIKDQLAFQHNAPGIDDRRTALPDPHVLMRLRELARVNADGGHQ